jgi:hypothetical protein
MAPAQHGHFACSAAHAGGVPGALCGGLRSSLVCLALPALSDDAFVIGAAAPRYKIFISVFYTHCEMV